MPSEDSPGRTRRYVGPVYPGTEMRHMLFPIAVAAIGTFTNTNWLAAFGIGILLVLLYGNMKWQAYFSGSVTQHTRGGADDRQ
jgi:hypothetical protein